MHDVLIPFSLAGILALGIAAQWIAWRTRLPSILLLLSLGFAVGPGLRWFLGPDTPFLNPDQLFGDLLLPVVSLSVCVILYEGGLTLRFRELRDVGVVVRNLVTVGALVTWLLATIFAHELIEFDWGLSCLLGAVLVVTGPTVIGPLLRQVRPRGQVGAVLKWEGIVIDPIGATLAVLVFEGIHLNAGAGAALHALVLTAAGGTILGAIGAAVIVLAIRYHLLPDSLDNAVSLTLVIVVFTISNAVQEESGLLAVTVMGVALANQSVVHVHHLVEFKENLRVLLISCLFIVLAAKLELKHLSEIASPGVVEFVLLLFLVVRPTAVWLSTYRSKLSRNERLFMAFLAPRGIVAAAVASVFALRLAQGDPPHPEADRLVAVTFLVIIATVAVYGLAAGPLALRLGLSDKNPQGVLLVGAHPLARMLAKALQEVGLRVLLVDSNRENVDLATADGLEGVLESILDEHAHDDLDLGGLGRMLALTPNDEVNTLATQRFLEIFGRRELYQLTGKHGPVSNTRSRTLFAADASMAALYQQCEKGASVNVTSLKTADEFSEMKSVYGRYLVPLFVLRSSGVLEVFTVDRVPTPTKGDTLISLRRPIPRTQSTSRAELRKIIESSADPEPEAKSETVD